MRLLDNPVFGNWRRKFSPQLTLHFIGLGVALSLPGDLSLYVVLPTHTEEAGIALGYVGLMLSANRLIRILINSPMGVLIEKMPRRRIVIPALICGALSSLLYTVPGFWPLLIGRLLWGTAWAGVWIGASTMILDISTSQNRGQFVGGLQMWFFVGSGISALLGGVLTDWLGYTSAFRTCALITASAAIIWWLMLPETQPHIQAPGAARVSAKTEVDADRGTGLDVSRQVIMPLGIAIALLGLNWLVFLGILGATLPLLLKERIGSSVDVFSLVIPLATFTGVLAAGTQLVSLVTSPAAGRLSDYTGKRWGFVVFSLSLGIIAMILTAIGLGWLIIVAVMLGAIATSVLQTQVMTLVGDYAEHGRRGRILGILNTVGDIGSALGPLMAYALLRLINLSGVFWIASGLLALALPWTIWANSHEGRVRQVETASPPNV